MKTLLRNLLASALLASGASAFAAGGPSVPLDSAPINLNDQASLQRGASNFVNYCMNCHSAQFMRYSHLTQIGLTEDQIKNNLMFGTDKIGDTMQTALDPKDAKEWFGAPPPDLTLVARVRGNDWLYTFLRSFYRDDTAPTGWNNEVFKNVGMPHVLHDLQGTQRLNKVGEKMDHGKMQPVMKLEIERAGTMTPKEYDLFVRDLVNYLAFMGEPAQMKSKQLGIIVLLFLVIAFFAALWLKHEYWKDVK
jgi:ubiquinol-cytochrome c reductase cytochrome c1 subunit